ncbi:MAG: bifunctional nuclease family protein [Bacillota bacterium]
MIEAKVEMVGSSMETNTPIVILKDKKDGGILPIGIGLIEAYAIHLGLNNKETPRPLTHELLSNILNQCEIRLKKIEIIDIKNQTFYGEITLEIDDNEKKIDSRPSDAIALALRQNVPIYIEDEVADKSFVYGDPHEYVDSLEFNEIF